MRARSRRTSTTTRSANGTITSVGATQSHRPTLGAAPSTIDGPSQIAPANAPTNRRSTTVVSPGANGRGASAAGSVSTGAGPGAGSAIPDSGAGVGASIR